MGFDNRITRIFHVDGKKQYQVKLISQNGKPLVGFSVFYAFGMSWYPGRKHFYMPLDAWKSLMSQIMPFNQQAMKGMLDYYLSESLDPQFKINFIIFQI